MIAILGGTGTGLVWGWLAGGVARPRRVDSVLVLVVAGAALLGQALVLAGVAAAVALAAALVVGTGLRLTWTSWLRTRSRERPEGVA